MYIQGFSHEQNSVFIPVLLTKQLQLKQCDLCLYHIWPIDSTVNKFPCPSNNENLNNSIADI